MDIKIGIRIENEGQLYRYGTDTMVVKEGGFDIDYLPYIQKVDLPRSEMEFDGGSPIPVVKINLWDAERDVVDMYNDAEHEALNVVIFVLRDGVMSGEYRGYMTDVAHSSGITSFSVRCDDGEGLLTSPIVFTGSTFQQTEILEPTGALTLCESRFEVVDNSGWEVLKASSGSTHLTSEVPAGSSTMTLDRGWTDNQMDKFIIMPDGSVSPNAQTLKAFLSAAEIGGGMGAVYVSDVSPEWTPIDERAEPMLVYYTDIINSGGKIQLTGIPTDINAPGSIKTTIYRGAGVTPAVHPSQLFNPNLMDLAGDGGRGTSRMADRLIVMAVDNKPVGIDDPDIGVGFLSLGVKIAVRQEVSTSEGVLYVPTGVEVPAFHRYHIEKIVTLDHGPHRGASVMEIVLNTSTLDPGQRYRISQPLSYEGDRPDVYNFGSVARAISKSKIKKGSKVGLANHKWMLKGLSIDRGSMSRQELDGLPGDREYSNALRNYRPPNVKGTMRHQRLDMVRDVRSYLESSLRESSADSADHDNSAMINNASGMFAVVSESHYMAPDTGGNDVVRVSEFCVFESSPDLTQMEEQKTLTAEQLAARLNNKLSNHVYYVDARSKDQLIDVTGTVDAGYRDAISFFNTSTYRLLSNPVPENAQDLGRITPIVYGRVNKVPLIHVISKKTSDLNNVTAGDDVYLYAAHPCGVLQASDIRLHLLREDGTEGYTAEERREMEIATLDSVIESPFPTSETVFEKRGSEIISRKIGAPYHRVDVFKTRQMENTYGIQLRGIEWTPSKGVKDVRYPIRHGVGSSILYGTYSGWLDSTGEITGDKQALIEHPMDILYHMAKMYGRDTFVANLFDVDNLRTVRSATANFSAAMFIDEDLGMYELLDKIALQFSLPWYNYNGKVKFANINLARCNYSKPLSETLNLVMGTEEDSDGYKRVYNKVIYNYRKSWVAEEFGASVVLDSSNDFYCSQADKAKGGKETLVIDANFVNSTSTAYEAAVKAAQLNCSRKIKYTVKAKHVDGIAFSPGDVIPMTLSKYGLRNAPVLVKSVLETPDLIEMEVVRFVNLLK